MDAPTPKSPWREGSVAVGLGPLVALVVASLTSSLRDDVGTTNVALVLVAVVVVAALTSRLAGITTAATAAVTFNFFHTQPFHSLRIDSGRDVATVCLLLAIGLVVSEMGAWRRRTQIAASRRLHGVRALEEVAAITARGDSPDEVWSTIRQVLIDELHLVECRFEPALTTSLPLLPRSGALVAPTMVLTSQGFAMPATGMAIEVAANGLVDGFIVVVPSEHSGSGLEARRLATALADQYAIARRLHRQVSA